MASLAELVQSLPPELYNQIYSEVFTTCTTSKIPIDGMYKPPVVLQVNRASRQAFARAYYRDTVFIFRKEAHIVNWLRSLPEGHLCMLEEVRLIRIKDIHGDSQLHGIKMRRVLWFYAEAISGALRNRLKYLNIDICQTTIRVEVRYKTRDGKEDSLVF